MITVTNSEASVKLYLSRKTNPFYWIIFYKRTDCFVHRRLPLGIQHLHCFREHICLILSLPIIIKLLYHLRQRAILSFLNKKKQSSRFDWSHGNDPFHAWARKQAWSCIYYTSMGWSLRLHNSSCLSRGIRLALIRAGKH